jgi:hypothetical protein
MRSIRRTHLALSFAVLLSFALLGSPAAPTVQASVPTLHPTGAVLTPGQPRGVTAFGLRLQQAVVSYPVSVDLSAWTPAVGNQGSVGSCTSWATGYYERYWLRNHALGETTTFAPMFLYSQISHGVDQGSSYPGNFSILIAQGITPQASYTYGDYNYTAQPTGADKTAAAAYKASSYALLFSASSSGNQTAVQAAMAGGTPVMLSIPVYPEFDHASTAYPLVNVPTSGELSRGNHAVFAAKYDANGVWIENSWGTFWGASGWAELSWAFVNQYAWEGWALSSSTTDVSGGAAPTITGFSPTTGGSGVVVTITGTGFTGASTVRFNGSAAASFTVVSDTSITAPVPVSAGTGPISVTTTGGTATTTASFVVTSSPVATKLQYGGTTSAAYGAAITLKATLKTSVTNVAVAGRSVGFTLNGTTVYATTNSTGVASVGSFAPSTVGSYPVGVAFAGDASYAATSATSTLKVVLPTPALKYTGPTTATHSASITLSATLKTSAGVALAGRTVSFTFNNVTVTAVTNSSGVASVVRTVPSKTGSYKVTLKFAGDSSYGAATANGTVKAV